MPKVIQAMIRVLDLDRSMRFSADVVDLHEAHRLDSPDFALVYLRRAENDMEIELTLNKGRTYAYTHGTGYGDIGVVVHNAATSRETLSQRGIECTPVKKFKRGEELLAKFFFVQDPDGYKIEMLERHGYYQKPIFPLTAAACRHRLSIPKITMNETTVQEIAAFSWAASQPPR